MAHPKQGDAGGRRRERDSFIVLQHVYTVAAGDPKEGVNVIRAAGDLGYSPSELASLVDHLMRAGYLRRTRAGAALFITPEGAEYIERNARRRRSVR